MFLMFRIRLFCAWLRGEGGHSKSMIDRVGQVDASDRCTVDRDLTLVETARYDKDMPNLDGRQVWVAGRGEKYHHEGRSPITSRGKNTSPENSEETREWSGVISLAKNFLRSHQFFYVFFANHLSACASSFLSRIRGREGAQGTIIRARGKWKRKHQTALLGLNTKMLHRIYAYEHSSTTPHVARLPPFRVPCPLPPRGTRTAGLAAAAVAASSS